jgi:hypothetical protein
MSWFRYLIRPPSSHATFGASLVIHAFIQWSGRAASLMVIQQIFEGMRQLFDGLKVSKGVVQCLQNITL